MSTLFLALGILARTSNLLEIISWYGENASYGKVSQSGKYHTLSSPNKNFNSSSKSRAVLVSLTTISFKLSDCVINCDKYNDKSAP